MYKRQRIYPSKTIQERLNEQIELCRWLYNRLLWECNKARENGGKITKGEAQAMIVELKKENPKLKKVYSKVLQMVNYQLFSNMRALSRLKKKGRKIGRLRYKEGWFKTLNFNQSGFKLSERLILSKVGEIPIKPHREIKGVIKGVIIKREKSGKWFAIFQVEDKPEPLPKINREVGIDVGVKHFLTDSVGRQIENPRFYEKSLKRIRWLHKELSRKKKGSNNREKARVRLAKVYEKLINQRNDFLHKLSRFYVDNYDVIVMEGLRITNMVRNHWLAKAILDSSWNKFFEMLSYKAERAGRIVLKVNPRGTSKGDENLDRDYRASINILNRGLVGLGRPEFTPVETEPLPVRASSVIETGSPIQSSIG